MNTQSSTPFPRLPRLALLCGAALAWNAVASAELPAIRLHRVQPLGGAAGSTVEVQVVSDGDEGAETLRFEHPGLRAEFVKAKQFRVQIAPDVPQGVYDARLVGRFGLSNPRLFCVSRGLTELAEKEPNNAADQAQPIEINTTLNAASDANEVDVFRFHARAGQRLALDLQGEKLESELDAVLSVTTLDGRALASVSDYHGRDPFVDFTAPAEGDYLAIVSDLSYRGGFPYRLSVSDRPHLENVSPRALEAGRDTELIAFGRNLGPGATPSAWKLEGQPLEELKFRLTAPPELLDEGGFRFFDHPTDHAVLPTAATCTLTGMQVVPPLADTAQRPQSVLVVGGVVTLEQEPNDRQEQAQPLVLPAVLSGRFDAARDVDWFEFTAAESGSHAFDVYCERIGGRADAYLVVEDEQGNSVGELDDFGHRMNAFDGHLRDPSGALNLNAGKKYRVLIADRYGRGGARLQYVLRARKADPDFHVAVIHRSNPNPSGLSLWRGGAEYLDVVIHRSAGHTGPITLTAENLPPGVHAAPTTIHDSSRGTFVLWSDRETPVQVAAIRLVARGLRGEQPVQRLARPYTRSWFIANVGSSRPSRELALATCETAPYRVSIEPARLEIQAGQKATVKAVVTRHWPEFTAALALTPLGFPGSFQMGAVNVPAGGGEANVEIQVQANAPPGEHTLCLQCQAQVPFSADPAATTRPNTLVTLPSLPVTFVVTPAEKK